MKLRVKNRQEIGEDVLITFELAPSGEHQCALPRIEAEPFEIGTVWNGEITKTLVRDAE